MDFIRLVAVVAAGTFLGACVTWQTESLQPERFRTADSTQTLRLILRSGETLIVHSPPITGDSLTGAGANGGAPPDTVARGGVPSRALDQAEVQRYDVVGPMLLAGVGVVALVAITKEALRRIPWCPTR
jgi:hypothetical protein